MKLEICPMCGIVYDENDLKYKMDLHRIDPSDHPLSAHKEYYICANCFKRMKEQMETRVKDIASRIEKYTFDVHDEFELPEINETEDDKPGKQFDVKYPNPPVYPINDNYCPNCGADMRGDTK